MADEYKKARNLLEKRFGMPLSKLPVHQQPCAYAEMREIVCKAELAAAKSRIGELEQALREIGKHTMESEDDIDFIIDACRNALHVTDKAAQK